MPIVPTVIVLTKKWFELGYHKMFWGTQAFIHIKFRKKWHIFVWEYTVEPESQYGEVDGEDRKDS